MARALAMPGPQDPAKAQPTPGPRSRDAQRPLPGPPSLLALLVGGLLVYDPPHTHLVRGCLWCLLGYDLRVVCDSMQCRSVDEHAHRSEGADAGLCTYVQASARVLLKSVRAGELRSGLCTGVCMHV